MRSVGAGWGERAEGPAWGLAGILVFWSFGYTIMRGSDLWWHIAGGRWMVEHASLYVREPFAFTAAGQWWLNDAWLADIIFHYWVSAFGLASLAYWKWLLLVATWLLLFRVASRLSGDRVAAFAAAVLGLATAEPFLDVRPQLYSFLGFAVLLDACVGRRPPAWLPLVFLVWANLHAGFVLGLAALPLLLLPAWIEDPRRGLALALLGLACIAACTLNPHGVEIVVRPLRYAFDTDSPFRTLGEWRPPFEPGGIQSWLYPYAIGAFGAATLVALVGQWRRGRPLDAALWATVLVGAVVLVLSLQSRRIVPFFAMAQVLVVAVAVSRVTTPLFGPVPKLVAPACAILLGVYWLAPLPQRSYAFDYLTAYYDFPVETVNFIEHNQLEGRVFNYYNWGGYLNMRTQGRMQVFIDGRADTVFSDDTYVAYVRVLHSQPTWRAIMDESQAEWVLWPTDRGGLLQQLLATGAWSFVYHDYKSALLRRKDAPPLPAYERPPDSAYQRLAQGWTALHEREFRRAEEEFRRALELQPQLGPACWELARAQTFLGNASAARETVDRCSTIFPDAERRRMALELIERIERGGVRLE